MEWKKAHFETRPHKDQYFILATASEMLNALLDESLTRLQKMLANKFVGRCRGEVEVLYRKLQYLDSMMEEWMELQRQWIYLENIFGSADIASKMGADAKRFQQVDHLWKEVMKNVNANPSVSKMVAGYQTPHIGSHNSLLFLNFNANYLEIFKEQNRILEEI